MARKSEQKMFWLFVIGAVSARFLPYVEINAYPSEDEKIYSRFDAKVGTG